MHGFNLKLYLELGLRLTKIHRGIVFYQSAFIKDFIDTCTEKRKNAPTKTEQEIYKLIANSVYGKMIEGFDKRMDCLFNTTRESALRNSSSPLYKGVMICDEDFSITFRKKKKLVLNQCWAVGFSILEISKYYMQDLYYRRIRPALGEDTPCTIVMSDTDSYLMSIGCKDEVEVMTRLKHVMDFSNLEPSHPLYDGEKAKLPGYLKNEVPKASILEAVALQSKTYAIRTDLDETINKAKGVKSSVKKNIRLKEYKRCLQEIGHLQVEQCTLRSKNHVNQMISSKKIAFSSFDDKRFLMCPIHSVPYGSCLIREYEKNGGKCIFCQKGGCVTR